MALKNHKLVIAYEREVAALLKNNDDLHLVAGLAAECGEVCALFQKASYKNTTIDLEELTLELGDILFYVSAISSKYLGSRLESLQKRNIEKLKKRYNEDYWPHEPLEINDE